MKPFQTQDSFLFGTQQQQQQQPNLTNTNTFGMGNNQQIIYNPQPIIGSTKPILTLQPSNNLRFIKLENENFNSQIRKMAEQIQLGLINNSTHIHHAENIIKHLQTNFELVKNEGNNLFKFSKVVDNKNKKILFLLNNIKNELRKLNESLEKEKNNYRILQLGNDLNITIPNDFLFLFAKELEERMISYSSQIEDIQTLINLYYSEENGSFNFNSDMVEVLITELYKCIKILLSDEATLNDAVNLLKSNFSELLKNYGMNEYQIKTRYDNYLEDNK